MLTTAGPTCLAICEKSLERVTGLGIDEGPRVGGVDGLLFAADVAGQQRAGEDADGERGQQREGRGEAVAANAFEEIAGGLLGVSIVESILIPY